VTGCGRGVLPSGGSASPALPLPHHFATATSSLARASVAAGRGRHSPPAALSRGLHFEGRKYGILKIGRFWQIDVCIA